jgi:hypothetical protein
MRSGRPSRGSARRRVLEAVTALWPAAVARPRRARRRRVATRSCPPRPPRNGESAGQGDRVGDSLEHQVNVEAGRSGGAVGFRDGSGSPVSSDGFPVVLQQHGPKEIMGRRLNRRKFCREAHTPKGGGNGSGSGAVNGAPVAGVASSCAEWQ